MNGHSQDRVGALELHVEALSNLFTALSPVTETSGFSCFRVARMPDLCRWFHVSE